MSMAATDSGPAARGSRSRRLERLAPGLAATLGLALSLVGCAPRAMDRTELALGTVCSIRVLDGASEAALDAAFARLRDIEATMSANAPGTVVDAVNRAAGSGAVAAPSDLRALARRALELAEASGGAFDPTVGPLVALWGIGFDTERVPAPGEIAAALPLVDRRGLVVDESAGTMALARAGMRLDLGGIAKGYAADEVARILTEHGVKAAVVDLGGNVKVVGRKPDRKPWRVGIQNPFSDRGERLGLATLPGGYTVVTSGVYERHFRGDDGAEYHHLIDPATGYPADGGLVSVTVIAESSMDADGLSTALFVMGPERGFALAEAYGVGAVYVRDDKGVLMNERARAVFELESGAFRLEAPVP